MTTAPRGAAWRHQRPRSLSPSAARTSISRTGIAEAAIPCLGTMGGSLHGTGTLPAPPAQCLEPTSRRGQGRAAGPWSAATPCRRSALADCGDGLADLGQAGLDVLEGI